MDVQSVLDRLLAAQDGGAWSYQPGKSPAVEPTCWATIALRAHGIDSTRIRHALAWLARMQQGDGAVPVAPGIDSAAWTTAHAILAWRLTAQDEACYAPHVAKAAAWLLAARGVTIPHRPDVFGHNTTLVGWSWVAGTHSWVEPTAYALLGLRAAGMNDHGRVREGVRMMLDRSISSGGWNYGNTRVFKNEMRPFPGPSGVALAALASETVEPRITAGIEYLRNELTHVRSPMSLAWGLLGLSAWDARPAQADEWLGEACHRASHGPSNSLHDALLLLACADPCPLLMPALELSHG